MFVKMPRNDTVLDRFGPYVSRLNVLSRRATAVQRQLRREGLGGYEPETQATLLTLVQQAHGPVEFLDVGAHIGLYSAMIAAIYPSDLVHVTAFEPTPDTARLCVELAEANRLELQVERTAVGSEEGAATLFVSSRGESSNSLTEGFRASTESLTVAVTTLDAYRLRTGVRPSVVKIDVETYEAKVLRGSLDTLADCRPAVVCELLPDADREATDEVLSAIHELGYHIHQWSDAQRWHEVGVPDVMGGVNLEHRDWLFTPDAIGDDFHVAVQEWSQAIALCPADTNLFTSGGTAPARGWNALYRADEPARA